MMSTSVMQSEMLFNRVTSETCSTRQCQIARWHVLLRAFALCLIGVLSNSAVVCGQDANDMPWFDTDSRNVKPVGIEVRPDESNPQRHTISPYQKPNSTTTNNNANNNNRAGGWGGGTNAGAALGSILSVLMWTLAIVVAIGLLGAMAYFLFRKQSNTREDEEDLPRRTIAESIQQLPFELEMGHKKGDFRSMAYQLYQQGDLRRAMILLFSHVLVSLDQGGFVRLKKGKTNRQYLRELQPYDQLESYYGQVMVRFEEAFFGDRDLDRPAFETCWNGLDSFQAGLESTAINTEVTL